MYFAVLADHRVKLKENEKDKYFDLAKELKKLWSMKVMFIPIIIDALGKVTKGLLKGLEDLKQEDKWRPSKLLHYWDQPEYWEESRRLEESYCHSNFNEIPSANIDLKNSQGVNNN